MTNNNMSILKPKTAIVLALALIATTFAGISSADGDEDYDFGWHWDNETGTLNIVPTPFINTTTFSYDVSISSSLDGTIQFSAEDTDVPTENVSLTTNLTDGYYWMEIGVWNDDSSWYDSVTLCMGMDCSDTQVDITYDETTMIATLHITDANQSDSITVWLYNDWTGDEIEITNPSDGDTIDMSTYGDGFFCLEIVANHGGFDIDSREICFQIGEAPEEPVLPWLSAGYDPGTMILYVDFYNLPENSTFDYFATIQSWDTGFETWDNGTVDSNTTTLEFDIDMILSYNGQPNGVYGAYMQLVDAAGDEVASGGTEFCYGDQTDCEEVDECPFENVTGSPCEPVASNPCLTDPDSEECMGYVMEYCANNDDPACDDMGGDGPTFICGNGDEIPFDLVNDGEGDCPDGADEQQYDADGSEINWFDCSDGSEIWIHQVNDGDEDCPYGEDEHYGTDDGDDIEIASMEIDIWFEQWDDTTMEFVMVQLMFIDDAETIANFAMMADMYWGNDDGEVTQNEVDLLIMMMGSEVIGDEDMSEIMYLNGVSGVMVDAWMDIEGLVEGDGEIVMVMGQVVAFETTAYADSTTHIFTIEDDDDSSEEPVTDEDCKIDSIWIHNSDTWSVSSITDSASTMAFEYEDFNDAWFTEDCPEDSGTVTFNLVKTDGGELPDDTIDDDWEDMDRNKFPICAYAYAVMLPDGTFDVRIGIGAAPESGDYIIDLVDGAEYMISVVCSDPEGDDMTVTIHNAELNLTSAYTSTAIAEASLLLSVPAGYDGTYIFDVTWTDGHHNEAGTLTVNGLGDGSTDRDISADGDGFLPGFTAALGIVALLGAAMISSRRN